MPTPNCYQIEELATGGWAVRVDACFQPNDPALPGDVPMSRERAIAHAKVLLARLGYDIEAAGEPAEVTL